MAGKMAKQDNEPNKVVPRGKAIERTDAELDDMTSAEAMEALMGEAADNYRENAPKGFETLLDSSDTKEN